MNLEEKLALFKEAALTDAHKQKADILAAYEAQLQSIYDERIALLKKKSEDDIRMESDQLLRDKNKAVSNEYTRIKHDLGEKHYEKKLLIFTDVIAKLRAFTQTDDYVRLLETEIKNAMAVAKTEPVTIYIDPADAKHQASLEAATGARLTLSEYSFIGGTRSVVPSKNILIDHSFQTKLDEAKNHFAI